MADTTPDRLVRELQASRQELSDILAAQAENQDWQPEPEQWSYRYIAAHLATTERECFLERVKQFAYLGESRTDEARAAEERDPAYAILFLEE